MIDLYIINIFLFIVLIRKFKEITQIWRSNCLFHKCKAQGKQGKYKEQTGIRDIDLLYMLEQSFRGRNVEGTHSRIKFDLSQSSLSCFISPRSRSSSTPRRVRKNSTLRKLPISQTQNAPLAHSQSCPYWDLCFNHKLLFTKYGEREMYVDEEPNNQAQKQQTISEQESENDSASEVVSQCLRALSQAPTETSVLAPLSTPNKNYHTYYSNDLKRARGRMCKEESTFSVRPFEAEQDGRTTIMLRNIPNKYSQQMVLQEIDAAGLEFKYDFFYLPIDYKNDCNVGYAFINLTQVGYVSQLYQAFHGKRWPRFNSQKICQVCYARIQGISQLMNHFKFSNSLYRDNRSRPLIFMSMEEEQNWSNNGSAPALDKRQYASSTI